MSLSGLEVKYLLMIVDVEDVVDTSLKRKQFCVSLMDFVAGELNGAGK
jgi:hypothetical protein